MTYTEANFKRKGLHFIIGFFISETKLSSTKNVHESYSSSFIAINDLNSTSFNRKMKYQ